MTRASLILLAAVLSACVLAEEPAGEIDPDVLRKVKKLVQGTLSEETTDREKAWNDLREMGNLAVPGLSALYKQKSTTPEMMQSILIALGDSKDKRAGPALLEMFQSKEKSVRRDAARALGDSGFAGAREALEKSAANKEEDEEVRLYAAVAGAKMNSDECLTALESFLKSERAEIRSRAVFALGKHGGAKKMGAIEAALDDAEATVREDAVEALRVIGDKKAVPALIKTSGDKDYRVRSAAMDALRGLTGEKSAGNAQQWQEWWEKNKAKFEKESK